MMNPERLDPKIGVIKRLFALSGNQCAYPGCLQCIVDHESEIIYGEICHIEAANKGGQRFNPNQTNEERRAFENLLLLCPNHHRTTDNIQKYTVEALKKIKADHEAKNLENPLEVPEEIAEKVFGHFQQRLEEIYELSKDTNIEVHGIKNNVQEILKQLKSIGNGQVIDDSCLYEDRLKFVKELRSAGKSESALIAIESFENAHWDSLSPEWKYRVLANIGIQLMDLGRSKEAAKKFISITELNYEGGDALGFIALGYAILGNKLEFDKIFHKGQTLNSRNINLWLAYLRTYGRNENIQATLEELPMEIRNNPIVKFYSGQILYEHGQESLGISLMEQSIDDTDTNTPGNWQLIGILVGAKLKSIVDPLAITFQAVSIEERKIVTSSILALTNALEALEGSEMISAAYHLLLNRATCYRVLNDMDNAVADFEAAWRISKSTSTFKQLINIYIITNQLSRGRRIVNEKHLAITDTPEDKIEVEFVVSRFEQACGNYQMAMSNLHSCLNLRNSERLKVLNSLTLIALEAENNEDAMHYSQLAVSEFPDNAEAWLFVGTCHINAGNKEPALVAFDHVYNLFESSNATMVDWYSLGLEYFQAKEYPKAIGCFERVAKGDRNDDVNCRLLYSYFHNSEYEKVLEFGLKLKGIAPFNPKILEAILRAYDVLGKTEEFEKLLAECLALENVKARDHFRWIGLLHFVKREKMSQAADLAMAIEMPSSLNYEQQFYVAKILLGEAYYDKGVSIMYEARKKHYDSPRVHHLFVGLWLNFMKNESIIYFPALVADECGVSVVDLNGKEDRYFLTKDNLCSGPHYLHPEDIIYKLLLGQAKDQIITIPNTGGSGSKLRVKEIFSKYTFAFHESLDLIERKYSDNSGLFFYTL